jgi:hypothetical protein
LYVPLRRAKDVPGGGEERSLGVRTGERTEVDGDRDVSVLHGGGGGHRGRRARVIVDVDDGCVNVDHVLVEPATFGCAIRVHGGVVEERRRRGEGMIISAGMGRGFGRRAD